MESTCKSLISDDLDMLQRMLDNLFNLYFLYRLLLDGFRLRWWSILKSIYHLIEVLVFFL
jgi:hypothetical protein